MDVTCIGDVNVDVLTSKIDSMPEHDAQMLLSDLRLSTGGCAANTAKALAVLGAKTRLIAKAGKDLYGDYISGDLGGIKNLDLRLARGEKTGVTLAINFTDSTRSFLTYTGGNSEFSIKDIKLNLVEGRCVHIASFFLQGLREKTKKIVDYAHDKGLIVSFDTGFDPRGWSVKDVSLIRKILKDVDIFFPNLREAEAVTGEKNKDRIVDELLSLGVGIVALKRGSKGAYICTKKQRITIPPYKVKVVDTTGAGDVFGAAFIYSYLQAWDLRECGRFAAAAAALKTKSYGSEKYPGYNEVAKML